MKSIPKLVVKDGRSIKELGKDIGSAHDLFCAIRDLGGTRKDIQTICKMHGALQNLLYRARGIFPDEPEIDDMVMNLDADPGIPTGFNCQTELIVDKRLGMWVMELNNSKGYILGDKKMHFIHPVNGECMENGMFDRRWLGLTDQLDLNAQAAISLSENPSVVENIFSGLSEGSDWKDEKIFFLGTVWKERAMKEGNSGANHGWNICAKALTCTTEGPGPISDEPLPVGKWPKNYYIAILIPATAQVK